MEEVLLCVVRMMFHLMFSFLKSHGLVQYSITTFEKFHCVCLVDCVSSIFCLLQCGTCPVWTISYVALILSCVDDLAPEVLLLLG